MSIAVDCISSMPFVALHVKNPLSCTSNLLIRSLDPSPFLCLDWNRLTVSRGLDFFSLFPPSPPPPPPAPSGPPTGTSFMYHWILSGGGSPVTSQLSFTDLPESLVMLFSCRTKCMTPVWDDGQKLKNYSFKKE